MGTITYESGGTYREFENHFNRKRKEELIREIWDAYGEIERLKEEVRRYKPRTLGDF